MKVLVDMNLSPTWASLLTGAGITALHWSAIGPATAPDHEIMAWARNSGYVVFTHDLDFGALLHATGAVAPSVVQFRDHDVRPDSIGQQALLALKQAEQEIIHGALITVDSKKLRITCLPLGKR